MFIFEKIGDTYDMNNYHPTWRERSYGKYDNYETCKEEAKKYSNKTSFKYGNSTAYDSAIAHFWINDFFQKRAINGIQKH